MNGKESKTKKAKREMGEKESVEEKKILGGKAAEKVGEKIIEKRQEKEKEETIERNENKRVGEKAWEKQMGEKEKTKTQESREEKKHEEKKKIIEREKTEKKIGIEEGAKAGEKKKQKETKQEEKAGKKIERKPVVIGGKKKISRRSLRRKKTSLSKGKEVKMLARLVRKKRKKPLFRGRFGKKSIRRVSKRKWAKWRKPRGIDIIRTKEDGQRPKAGFGTARMIKAVHPSGFREIIVRNAGDLEKIEGKVAVRISGKVGLKKRKQMIEIAVKKKIWVLNW